MAIRKKYIKEVKLNNIRTKRISSHSLTNISKLDRIKSHFEFVKNLKNDISHHIYTHIDSFLFNEQKNDLRKEYKLFKNKELSAWELQQIYQEFFDKYDEVIKKYKKNHKFRLQNKFEITYYKKNTSTHNKGDVKSKNIVFKNTQLSQLLNWLIYVPHCDLDSVLKGYNENASEKVNTTTKAFNDYLNKIRNSDKWPRIKQLILKKQHNLVKKIKLIKSYSSAYRKAVKENPSANSICNEVFIDPTNTHFKYFYKFKIAKKEVIYVPLSYNNDFHNGFENINLSSNHYVSLNAKGHINIGLQERYTQTFEKTICKEQIAGIDLNIKHNFCVINIVDNYTEIDYDRHFISQQIMRLKAIDAIGYNRLSIDNKRQLTKIVSQTESYFQHLISNILNSLQDQGITEIVLEDLNLQKTNFKTFSEEFGVSYSRLVKILRLNQIKHWFKNQANKRGIKVHFTSPCATSIECSQCHNIDKSNRQSQETFKCTNCHYTINADNQASFNIGERVRVDVLQQLLHNYDKYGQCTPKIMNRDNIKRTIERYYLKQSILNIDPHNSRLQRDTNSKCEA